jgi:hypothetical protein
VSAWTREELDRFGAAEELEIAPRTGDGSLGRAVPIWVVRVDDGLYVRSWRGSAGGWYRAARARGAAHVSAGGVERDVAIADDARDEVNDAIDAAYRDKYARYPSYVPPMVSEQARATTLALVPLDEDAA